MNAFDISIVEFLNKFVRSSFTLDQLMMFISGSNLLKGGVIVGLVWLLWFRRSEDALSARAHILATLAAALVAMALARWLQAVLPFRHRPIEEPALDLVLPYSVPAGWWDGHTSFPSDHAVLFFALAFGMQFVSRSVGLAAIAYVSVVIGFPRIFLGFHYPTDIIAGALIGGVTCAAFNQDAVRTRLGRIGRAAEERMPGAFYACFFLLTYQMAVLFWDLRATARMAGRLARVILSV